MFPLDYIANVDALRVENPKLIMCVITFKVIQVIWPWYMTMVLQHHGETDDLR